MIWLTGARPERTVVVCSADAVPTGEMVTHPALALPSAALLIDRIGEVTRRSENLVIDAAALAAGLVGSIATANIMVLGAAVQAGALPLPAADVERAIELNGVAVDANVAAFRWGRAWVDDRAGVEAAAGLEAPQPAESTDQLIERLAADLVDYQSPAYAQRFREVVDEARRRERSIGSKDDMFTAAVARNLHKLMAYKDEYEVARLLLSDESRQRYEAVGGTGTRVAFHLHPPALRAVGMTRKIKMQRTAAPTLRALRAGKHLRGTMADPFRWAEVRRLERSLIPEYIAAIDRLIRHVDLGNVVDATAVASLPDQVRGYESLKLRRAAAYRLELASRLVEWPR